MSASLPAAIDSLYATFARVPRPSAIEYCPHCFLPEEERAVLAVPLRELSADVLRPYASNVMYTIGGAADLRYFLPRIMEIAAGEGFSWPDLETLAGRLRLAEWKSWQDQERDAVQAFLDALWAHALADDPETEDINTILCAIGNAEDDLEPYLAEWVSALARPAAMPMAAAALQWLLESGYRSERNRPRLTNAFWRDRDDQAAQVITWMSSTGLRMALVAACAAAEDEETLQTLADIDDLW